MFTKKESNREKTNPINLLKQREYFKSSGTALQIHLKLNKKSSSIEFWKDKKQKTMKIKTDRNKPLVTTSQKH